MIRISDTGCLTRLDRDQAAYPDEITRGFKFQI